MRILLHHFGIFAYLALLASGVVIARESDSQSETEKRYLISITNEISNIKSLAQQAASTADDNERVRFDYVALQRDLDAIQAAIEQHVKEPARTPRRVDALTTRYTTQSKDE